ncbi:MAG: tRNA uridine-5-carboxymethylaminomethyl(34) synthesis GTPase MnmE [Lachnospiraceae bacterium]|nr:tRNA uridine-5-carboxymethylaminomethyl(34) synthesis GTPase MnmE [Lachnospiraceae bacterium]
MMTDTIAAIATALSPSGIGIIRVSGEEAFKVVNRIFKAKSGKSILEMQSHTVHYGHIYDGDEIIDEVMVLLMKAPNSFTMEDTVEIDCHGGVYVMNRILQTVLKNGARLSEPGEFTKRAFLNGRIDLTKAEAIMDLIQSKNEAARKNSMIHLKGDLYRKIKTLREDIIYEIAFIESALDDPEHISLDGFHERLSNKALNIIKEIEKLLSSADNGRLIKEGINTVIVGKPNAGKSSFLNLLLGEDRAIVTDIAGTTRDTLEESVYLDGMTLNLIDTAGIRDTEDVVEKIGVNKAKEALEKADLMVYIIDSSVSLDNNDRNIIELLDISKTVILLNKSDLNMVVSEDDIKKIFVKKLNSSESDVNELLNIEEINLPDFITISAKEKEGLDVFTSLIKEKFFKGELSFDDEVTISSMRQKEALSSALHSMKMVQQSLEDDMPEDFYSIDLMNAYACLGEIIGEEVGEDLVNEIFSKFCMGK